MVIAAIPIFASVLWLLVVYVVVALWFVAISDIASRMSNGLFSRTQMVSMVTIVSVVAIMSVGAAGAVVLQSQTGTISTKYDGLPEKIYGGCGGPRSSFVFSFGLERSLYPPDPGATDDANTKAHKLCRSLG